MWIIPRATVSPWCWRLIRGTYGKLLYAPSGSATDSHYFDAYGWSNQIDPTDPYTGFGGQWGYYHDYETGLERTGQRYYDPNPGRFTTSDPTGYAGGLNLFAFAGCSPINFIDPKGNDRATAGAWPNYPIT